MLFVVIARDRPGALEIRKANRAAHLAYIEETGVVREAGPLLDPDGEMAGSLLVLDVPDIAAARRWSEADPYNRAGLFERVEIHPWKKVIG